MYGTGHQESANRRAGRCLRSFLTCRHVGPSCQCLGNARSTTRLDHSSATRRRQGCPRTSITQLTRDADPLACPPRRLPAARCAYILGTGPAGSDPCRRRHCGARLTRRPPGLWAFRVQPDTRLEITGSSAETSRDRRSDCSPHDAHAAARHGRAVGYSVHVLRADIVRLDRRSFAFAARTYARRRPSSQDHVPRPIARVRVASRQWSSPPAHGRPRVVAAARRGLRARQGAAPSSECSACSKPPTCCCPSSNIAFESGGRPFVLDYAYVSQRRFIEYYELGSHSTPSAVAYDNERLTLLCNAGWLPLIFTDDDDGRRDRGSDTRSDRIGAQPTEAG